MELKSFTTTTTTTKKKNRYKKLKIQKTRISISQPYRGMVSGYNQELQIWRSVVTAQIYLVFEKLLFLLFSHLFFQKKLDVKKVNRSSISQPYSGVAFRVHSGVAYMESKYDCSISFCISRNGVFYDFF